VEMRELGLSAVGRSCRCWRLAGGEKAGSVGWRRRKERRRAGSLCRFGQELEEVGGEGGAVVFGLFRYGWEREGLENGGR
jgi:hypothetical protein